MGILGVYVCLWHASVCSGLSLLRPCGGLVCIMDRYTFPSHSSFSLSLSLSLFHTHTHTHAHTTYTDNQELRMSVVAFVSVIKRKRDIWRSLGTNFWEVAFDRVWGGGW